MGVAQVEGGAVDRDGGVLQRAVREVERGRGDLVYAAVIRTEEAGEGADRREARERRDALDRGGCGEVGDEVARCAGGGEVEVGRTLGERVGRGRIPINERELRIKHVLQVGLGRERTGNVAPLRARDAERGGGDEVVAAGVVAEQELAIGRRGRGTGTAARDREHAAPRRSEGLRVGRGGDDEADVRIARCSQSLRGAGLEGRVLRADSSDAAAGTCVRAAGELPRRRVPDLTIAVATVGAPQMGVLCEC